MRGYELESIRQPTCTEAGIIAFCRPKRHTIQIPDSLVESVNSGLTKFDDIIREAVEELE